MIKLEQIQNRIVEAIKQSGMTQSEIARQLGVKHQQISCYQGTKDACLGYACKSV